MIWASTSISTLSIYSTTTISICYCSPDSLTILINSIQFWASCMSYLWRDGGIALSGSLALTSGLGPALVRLAHFWRRRRLDLNSVERGVYLSLSLYLWLMVLVFVCGWCLPRLLIQGFLFVGQMVLLGILALQYWHLFRYLTLELHSSTLMIEKLR